jgi:hypothetical protein
MNHPLEMSDGAWRRFRNETARLRALLGGIQGLCEALQDAEIIAARLGAGEPVDRDFAAGAAERIAAELRRLGVRE